MEGIGTIKCHQITESILRLLKSVLVTSIHHIHDAMCFGVVLKDTCNNKKLEKSQHPYKTYLVP